MASVLFCFLNLIPGKFSITAVVCTCGVPIVLFLDNTVIDGYPTIPGSSGR